MGLSPVWQHHNLRDRRNLYIILTLPIVAITAARWVKSLRSSRSKTKIIPSPRQSLQLLKGKDIDELPYPRDALPGCRDVDTPYGNIRVYEWGPENGRKVLCIHGISTPSITFAGLAELLVERGCRVREVMLFDLFGRGYSDVPDPNLYRQDMGLWTSQILLVLASSKLSWTGTDRFTLIGYSLGGGISASFTSTHPELVESLILIAPGGLLRPSRISRSSKLLYGNLLPGFVVRYFVGKRLRGDGRAPSENKRNGEASRSPVTDPQDVAESEVPGHPAHARDSDAALFPDRPQLSIARAVSWQVDAHPGFLRSFISSIKYAPVSFEHERWRLVGSRCSARRTSAEPEKLPGLDENKVLVILGAQDPVIIADETEEDATTALGTENVKVVRLEGAHDVPVVNSRGCVDAITEFWGDSPV